MADFSKSTTSLLAHAAATNPASFTGTAVDVSTKISARILLFHGFVEATANDNPQKFYIQISGETSGNEDWATVATYTMKTGTPADETLSGAESDDTLTVTTTAGFVAGDVIYIQDTGTLADSEWSQVESVTATVITITDTLTNAKDGSDIVFGNAQVIEHPMDLSAVLRVRVIYENQGATAANTHYKATLVTGDSFA
jgi:hypothetical protein